MANPGRPYALAFIAFIAAYYFTYWIPFSLIPLGEARWVANVGSLLVGALAARHVWSVGVRASDGVWREALRGALVLGGIGFVAGFFGPMIFAPDANQGPLLGLFITGPGGFALGGIGGFVRGVMQRHGA